MVDQVLPLEEVRKKAIEKAELLGSFSGEAFETTKRNRVEEVEERVRTRLAEKEHFFIDCWFTSEARERLKDAMAKF